MHALALGNGFLTLMTSLLGPRDLSGGFSWLGDVFYGFRRGGTLFPTCISPCRAKIILSQLVTF